MWCCLTPRAEPGVLQLGEVADLRARPDVRARPEVAERADPGAVLDDRRLDDARPRRGSRPPIVLSTICEPAPIVVPSPTDVAPAQDHVRLEGDVLGERRPSRRGRPSTGRASSRRRACARSLIRVRRSHSAWASSARSLIPSSRPSSSTVTAHDEPAVGPGELDELGQVQLAGLRRRLRAPIRPAQPGGVERVEAGVDLVDRDLLVGRVLRLDDPLDRAGLVADRPGRGRPDRSRRPRRARSPPRRAGAPRGARRGARPPAAARRRSGRGPRRRRRGARRAAAATASPVPRGSAWRAKSTSSPRASRTAAVAGLVTTSGPPTRRPSRPGVDDVGDHRPAGERWRSFGVRDFIRVPRPAARTTAATPRSGAGTWGVHEGRRGRAGIGAVARSRRGQGPARVGRMVSSEGRPDAYGRPARGVKQGDAAVAGRRRVGCTASRAGGARSPRSRPGRPSAAPRRRRRAGGRRIRHERARRSR